MSFSSRRRNYLLKPHRRDGLIEWMKSMLVHSFVLDALDSTGADTFSHFEMIIEEHRHLTSSDSPNPSRLKQLVPTVGTFHTPLPLRKAFEAYNAKYCLTARRHVQISFNELRHILNLAQIMALRGVTGCDEKEEEKDEKGWEYSGKDSPSALLSTKDVMEDGERADRAIPPPPPPPLSLSGEEQRPDPFKGPQMITFDGDQTLYSDGANFESNPKLANYLYLLLRHGVTVVVVTAAGYEYEAEKYEYRLSGLLHFFKERELPPEDCARFYLFGGECNYLLHLGQDYKLHAVNEHGPGGWLTSTRYLPDSPANWDPNACKELLDVAEQTIKTSSSEQKLRARVIRKKRAVGLIPKRDEQISREALDETVLRVQKALSSVTLPFCAFNGGKDAWVDVGNKRVGVRILQSYLGIPLSQTLHIGDQFLNTGNDYAARDVCPCVWITDPEETTYILKSILRLAGVSLMVKKTKVNGEEDEDEEEENEKAGKTTATKKKEGMDFSEITRRSTAVELMDVYTGEIKQLPQPAPHPKPQDQTAA